MSKWGRKQRPPPVGWEVVEPTLTAIDNELRDRVNESHEGKRKAESQWPVHQLNWQRTRYIYDMHYKYNRISKEVVDHCAENKIIDRGLMSYWLRPGYDRLCSTFSVDTANSKFGAVSVCRVPSKVLDDNQIVENPMTGCRGCASGPTTKNIFGNKDGEYLADIHVARELRAKAKADDDEEEEEEDRGGADDEAPVGAADGGTGDDKNKFWAKGNEVLDEQALAGAAEEARAALEKEKKSGKGHYQPPGKRQRR